MDRGVEERRGYDRPRSKITLAATIDVFVFFCTVTSTWVDVLGNITLGALGDPASARSKLIMLRDIAIFIL